VKKAKVYIENSSSTSTSWMYLFMRYRGKFLKLTFVNGVFDKIESTDQEPRYKDDELNSRTFYINKTEREKIIAYFESIKKVIPVIEQLRLRGYHHGKPTLGW
jgi:hypothetical protein